MCVLASARDGRERKREHGTKGETPTGLYVFHTLEVKYPENTS